MSLLPIGKIERVNLRSMWKREDTHFTKWLADNIDYLNEIIDLDISVESIEERVGPYRVDIFGESGDGRKVIIENQLEKTDHTHLGQLLTYLVNLDVKVAIWITSDPIDEHQAVIEWLNEITPDDLSFFLIKVEGIKIKGQESVAPLVAPSDNSDAFRPTNKRGSPKPFSKYPKIRSAATPNICKVPKRCAEELATGAFSTSLTKQRESSLSPRSSVEARTHTEK